MLPVQFHAILRQHPFSHTQSRTLISRPSREGSFYNFRARPLLIIVLWQPFLRKYVTHAILCDIEMATFFARPTAHTNIPALQGALLL